MSKKIRVSILDDHQGIIDGYLFRLGGHSQIEVVAMLSYMEELEPALAKQPADVLLLDINVPTSPANLNPYPILYTIPKLLDVYPGLNILVITMHNERALIRSVMETGASGYILKDDQSIIRDLANVILSVANGGIVLSQQAHQLLIKHEAGSDADQLTERQLEVLSLCAAYPDWTTTQLSGKMSVANSTVRNLLSGAYIRLGVHTRLAAVSRARELGIITPLSPNTTPRR
ncbi:MAG: response regulator transcription factor [Chloroflexi bacterium]|nr:response regulator transcription factor [Chloroflexota bacterium]